MSPIRLLSAGSLLLLAPAAAAQSFNMDLGDPSLGQPSSSYGGAAAQVGPWNGVDGGAGMMNLVDVAGNPTMVTVAIVPGSGSALNWDADNAGTTGDDELLMDDLHDVGPEAFGAVSVVDIVGVEDGVYDVYTYSWAPDFPADYTTTIEVLGSTDPAVVVGGATWPGSHVEGITFARQRVTTTGGTISVQATTEGAGDYGSINGIQLVLLDAAVGSNYCVASVNSTGAGASISGVGSASVAANDLELVAAPVPNQPGIFFYGPNQTQLAFGNGFRCVAGQVVRLPVIGASSGEYRYTIDNTNLPPGSQFTAGATWNFQAWYRDPAGGGASFNLSDGLEVTFLP